MQALTAASGNLVLTALVLALSVLGQGCAWKRALRFESPSHDAAIEIWQTRGDPTWGTRVELVSGRKSTIKRTRIFENRREAIVQFVHVYWSPDETTVGVMASGANVWYVAFDLPAGVEIPFAQIRDDFAESIRKAYDVPKAEDPIDWAARADAAVAFGTVHPEMLPPH